MKSNSTQFEKGYLGNPNLPTAGTDRKYSVEEIKELEKCAGDLEYFAEKYFTIVHPDKGKMLIPLYPYQKAILKKLQNHRFNVLTQSRQSGKTTTITVFILWFIIFNKDKNVAILANKERTAKMILRRIKIAYEKLPDFLKEAVVEWNKSSVELQNGCTIFAAATSADSISGESVALLFVDEVAKIENWDEFYSSTYPTISSGKETRVMLVSTVKGLNHYWRLWTKAVRGESEFVPTEVKWHEVPGRDEEWKNTQIDNTSEDQFLQEHDNVFLGSQDTLISMSVLRNLVDANPIWKDNKGMKVYSKPVEDHNYVMTVDTSHGKGLDYSCFSVFDITQYPFEQVAVYRADDVSPFLYPSIIYDYATQYNNAWLIVENNDMGSVVAAGLNYDFEYENLLNAGDDFGQSNAKYELGTKTTIKSKAVGCSSLKELIENEKLVIHDLDTIMELTQFVAVGKSYRAEKGSHDDTVATLFQFGWFCRTELFNEIFLENTVSDELYRRRAEREQEEMPPVGFFDHGRPSESAYDLEPGEEIWIPRPR